MNKNNFSWQLYRAMLSHGNLIAINFKGFAASYSELLTSSLSFASQLKNRSIENETVGIVCDRNPVTYIGLLGVVFAGCTYVPLSPSYNAKRLKAIITDTGLRYVAGSNKSLNSLLQALSGQDLPDIEFITIPDYLSAEELNAQTMHESKDSIMGEIRPSLSNENFIYIMYTSGSSGIPKGVGVTGENLMEFLDNMKKLYPLAKGFRASQTFDLTFDPSVSDIFFTWMNGGVLCILPDEDLLMPHNYILREKITFWNSVPTIGIFLYKMGLLSEGIFSSLTHSMFCGEQLPKYLADAWQKAAPNSSIENLYGPTEATIYISRYIYKPNELKGEFKNSVIPIGSVFPGHEFALIDRNGQRIFENQGEIVFKGKQVTSGYLNNEIQTQLSFVTFEWDTLNERWYRSGDLGFYNSEGVMECIGRIDSQIKIAGRRVEIGEIESALMETGILSSVVVVPIRGIDNSVVSCAAYITENLSNEDKLQLKRSCLKFLDAVFMPKKFIKIDQFPLTVSGKIDRKKLEFQVLKN